jgi:4-amino-4-deoxy-L-arabinose transferase-like glycosyltransferase
MTPRDPLAGGDNRNGARDWHRYLIVPCLVVGVSLVVRLVALIHWGTGAIEPDGAQYASIAEHLRKGLGYGGLGTPGRELNFPPLFPLLIFVASFVTKSYWAAGRLVAFVFGALLPLPVFGIALRLFNRRTAWVAAALAALHPLLVNLSFTVWSEGPYATILLTAIYLVLRALDHPGIGIWAAVGGTFGLAYLIRPEALVPMFLAAIFAVAATEGVLAIRCKRAVAAIAVFAVLVLPEVILIYGSTGKVRLEGKTTMLFAQAIRMLDAEDGRSASALRDQPSPLPNLEDWEPWEQKWTSNAINADLEPTGVWMRPNAEVIRDTNPTFQELFHIMTSALRHNIPAFLDMLSSRWLGAPFLSALALVGLLHRPWRRPLASKHLFVTLVPAAAVAATFSAILTFPRYYFILVPFLLIWSASGLIQVGQWTKATMAAARWRFVSPVLSAWIVSSLIGLAMIIYPIRAVRSLYEFSSGSPLTRVDKQVGLWIGQQQHHSVKIMDLTTPLAFHADGEFAYFPYCTGDLALRFLDADKIDYVVLRQSAKYTKYYQDWLAHGIPDPRAQVVHVASGAAGDILVYRWNRADSPPQKSQRTVTAPKSTSALTQPPASFPST